MNERYKKLSKQERMRQRKQLAAEIAKRYPDKPVSRGQPAPPVVRHNGSDPLVISGEDFRKALQPIIDDDNGDLRPLARFLGKDPRNIHRKLYSQKWVTFNSADEILTKLGLQYLLDNGTISVVPNPRWSQEKWHDYMKERGCA